MATLVQQEETQGYFRIELNGSLSSFGFQTPEDLQITCLWLEKVLPKEFDEPLPEMNQADLERRPMPTLNQILENIQEELQLPLATLSEANYLSQSVANWNSSEIQTVTEMSPPSPPANKNITNYHLTQTEAPASKVDPVDLTAQAMHNFATPVQPRRSSLPPRLANKVQTPRFPPKQNRMTSLPPRLANKGQTSTFHDLVQQIQEVPSPYMSL